MNRFASGLLTGGMVMAAVGVGWLMSDSRTRRRMVRGSRRAMRKTEDLLSGVSDIF